MKRILIADASKSSTVITSEVFKDYFPGIQVSVTKNAEDTLELLERDKDFDAIIVDFDLPDRDGADLSARIKKMMQIPILMTSYDRPEAAEAIETDLAGYDDCRNWVKKPVRADVIVNIAHRYCTGKYRTQRRLECSIPALLEVIVTETHEVPLDKSIKKVAASKTKTTKTTAAAKKAPIKKVANTKTVITTKKTWIPAYIEDCSLGGIKLSLPYATIEKLSLGKAVLSTMSSMVDGSILSIQIPKWDEIITNAKLTHAQLTNNTSIKTGTSSAKNKQPISKSATKKPISAKQIVLYEPIKYLPALKGSIAWKIKPEDKNTLYIGVKVENNILSKKLFESVLQQEK